MEKNYKLADLFEKYRNKIEYGEINDLFCNISKKIFEKEKEIFRKSQKRFYQKVYEMADNILENKIKAIPNSR